MKNSTNLPQNISNTLFSKLFTSIKKLPYAVGQAFSFKRNVSEIKTLRKTTKVIMLIMLIATFATFILGHDFSFAGWIGLVTSTAVVLNLILVDQGRLTNYSWGALGCAVWLIIALNNRLIGDIASQTFYLVMQFVGISVWNNKIEQQTDKQELVSRSFSWLEGLFWLVVTITIYLIVLFFSKQLNGTQVYLDATLLPLGIVGMVLMTYGYRSQWVAWIALDGINVVIWFNQLQISSPASTSMFILQIIMLINAMYGAYLWFFGQKEAKK
ncbi:nicotinamide riboside transporter PnuC [Pediococcus claussenii]|uniref:Nicotinamide mononucleotide transporter PnuC family protein n=1 Tax=Pediococcus claussenii (strain ATCC BAA-344 / DSM 14800 / JCM 18046 / KCTC 3811 / LMG 21948 / P06) TaxID=701521 RepID=G8PB20_PEDCP|nr:nicotinamide riboside transporter PnuC [Pediococcus claussenii]AEV94649.1 nicotinamide mononucleotide transporter PnuC family protein [Pediococcus claussenii ATCC BAA-344]ANZ69851.1 ribosyl nicotinamide transporter [Pediococcus claussenii]ANZ71668.1 ribosyl nicotinamide transporter [Pediococcus claussenii]KRN20829.1 pnuC protein [Pediococcus claussenii]